MIEAKGCPRLSGSSLPPEPPRQQLVEALNAARTKWGNELRTASGPCCAGAGDGAGGSAVVGLDPDAGLIAATGPSSPLPPEPRRQQLVAVLAFQQLSRHC